MSREFTKPIPCEAKHLSCFWDGAGATPAWGVRGRAGFVRARVGALVLFAGLVGVGAVSVAGARQAEGAASTMLREGELRESERRQAEPGIRAIARAREDLALALTTPGRVAAVLAKPGARVRAGDALLALEASEAKAEVELLRVRAASRLEEQASKAEWDLAKLEEERWNTVHERGASTDMQLRKAELETKRSKLAYELFVQQREEAALQLEQAEARLRAFTLVAPVDGLVDEVVVEVGEVIEPGKPVVRLVNPSVLRIDVAVPTQQTLALSVGGKAIMTSLLTTPATVATGTITHIANVADASSATRLVRVEVPTPEGLPAGIECFVRFGE